MAPWQEGGHGSGARRYTAAGGTPKSRIGHQIDNNRTALGLQSAGKCLVSERVSVAGSAWPGDVPFCSADEEKATQPPKTGRTTKAVYAAPAITTYCNIA